MKIPRCLSEVILKELKKYCKMYCTRKLGWDESKRENCRDNSPCSQYSVVESALRGQRGKL